MRAEAKEGLLLVAKSFLVVLGGILFAAGTVDLVVDGFNTQAAGSLLVGLALAGLPLGLAFRDAARHARRRGVDIDPSQNAPRGPRGGG